MDPQHLRGIGMTSQRARDRMLARLREAGITDARVLAALNSVPRHIFVDEALASRAYEDTALPIGYQQTISQPYIVAYMTEVMLAGRHNIKRVLEIGTGSGYQAAVLAHLATEVYTIERIRALQRQAQIRFIQLRIRNVQCKIDDSPMAWQEQAPFDGILVTAAAASAPEELLQLLVPMGRLVVPVGFQQSEQRLMVYEHTGSGFETQDLGAVKFVPLIRS